MRHVIHSQELTRRFGKTVAVENLDIQVDKGTVCAFIGPNGAGKTTTIRMLLGLVKPDAGTCEVLGFPPGHVKALGQLGAMVESPSLYDHLTGRENVEITRLMRNLPKSETDRVLTHVGLSRDAHRTVLGYSLGMRQRLGLALALLGSPKLLILDEPTNGLDPAGILEIRDLIHKLPQETGATVFLSSHLLAEVDLIAKHLIVINHGRLRYQGPISELGGQETPQLRLRVDDQTKAVACLSEHGIQAIVVDEYLHIASVARTETPQIADCLVRSDIQLFEMSPLRVSLEDRVLALLEEK